jgi:hypothetical protein
MMLIFIIVLIKVFNPPFNLRKNLRGIPAPQFSSGAVARSVFMKLQIIE